MKSFDQFISEAYAAPSRETVNFLNNISKEMKTLGYIEDPSYSSHMSGKGYEKFYTKLNNNGNDLYLMINITTNKSIEDVIKSGWSKSIGDFQVGLKDGQGHDGRFNSRRSTTLDITSKDNQMIHSILQQVSNNEKKYQDK